MQCCDVCSFAGPGDALIVPRISDQGNGNFRVDYTPTVAGRRNFRPLYRDSTTFLFQLIYLCDFITDICF